MGQFFLYSTIRADGSNSKGLLTVKGSKEGGTRIRGGNPPPTNPHVCSLTHYIDCFLLPRKKAAIFNSKFSFVLKIFKNASEFLPSTIKNVWFYDLKNDVTYLAN